MPMLERIAGNRELKQDLKTALGSGRIAHSILLVGEPGCGAGFAARCLAADYLYPAGGPHAEAVLKKEDTECLVLQGEGASGQIPVKKVREAREAIQRSALSTDAAGRVLFIYGAQNLNGSSANAMLKIIEEPPEGVLFLLTATSAATVLPTIRSRCAAYTIAPVPAADCAARLKAERLPAKAAEELAFLYEGHIGTALKSWNDPTAKAALGMAKTLCGYAAQGDTYRALALLTKYERDKDGFAALLWERRYDVVHLNIFQGMSLYYAHLAKRAGVPVRIAHSHNTDLRQSLTRPLKLWLHRRCSQRCAADATALWACSERAARFLFPTELLARCGFTFIPNGIDTERFRFHAAVREDVRRELGLTESAVRTRTFRGRKLLIDTLKKEGYLDERATV